MEPTEGLFLRKSMLCIRCQHTPRWQVEGEVCGVGAWSQAGSSEPWPSGCCLHPDAETLSRHESTPRGRESILITSMGNCSTTCRCSTSSFPLRARWCPSCPRHAQREGRAGECMQRHKGGQPLAFFQRGRASAPGPSALGATSSV